MTLPQPTLNFVNLHHHAELGVFVTLLDTRLKKKCLIFPNKYIEKYRYFWRPIHQLTDKKYFMYTEYGNNKMPFINIWYEIIINIDSPSFILGFPNIDQLYLYAWEKVNKRTILHGKLMEAFGLNIFKKK